jgi:hypothetical protein
VRLIDDENATPTLLNIAISASDYSNATPACWVDSLIRLTAPIKASPRGGATVSSDIPAAAIGMLPPIDATSVKRNYDRADNNGRRSPQSKVTFVAMIGRTKRQRFACAVVIRR